MKTIKQIADEIGVSKQAVYKRYKGRLHTGVYPYAHTVEGALCIDEVGENLIKQDFLKNPLKPPISEEAHTDTHTERIQDIPIDTTTNALIQMLQRELEIKNKQIEELTATIRIQAESIKAERNNELAETIIDGRDKLSAPAPEKVSLWNRIFRNTKDRK